MNAYTINSAKEDNEPQSHTGTLYLVATPIGNLDDITIRAIKTLLTVPVIACEDTRRAGQLLAVLRERYSNLIEGRSAEEDRYIRYDDQKEMNATVDVLNLLERGKSVALISDAGTPLISDPGYRIVTEAIKKNIRVEVIPGPSAAIAALTGSGLPPDKFLFYGYPPEKTTHRQKLLLELRETKKIIPVTFIFYSAPHKLGEFLTDIYSVLGDVPVVVARELTKIHEEVWRGKVSEARHHFLHPKGEFVLLLHL